MNVGLDGVVYIWLNIIWVLGWPFIIVPIYLYVKKNKIEKKLLFFIIGILACYTIHILFELASVPFLSGELKIGLIEKDYNYFKWIVLVATIVKLIVSIIVLSALRKLNLFQKNNSIRS